MADEPKAEHKPESEAVAGFLEFLRQLPSVSADLSPSERSRTGNDPGSDGAIELRVAGKPLLLVFQAKRTVYPQDARKTLWQFHEFSQTLSKKRHAPQFLVIGDAISPGARDLLRAEGVGYYDSAGSLYLPAPGAFFDIQKPPAASLARSVRNVFSGRRAQVVHALLMQPGQWTGVHEMAEHAHVSPFTASQVLTTLERFEWVVSRGRGPNKQRHLQQPAALLDAWAEQLASKPLATPRRFYIPAVKADALVDHVARVFDARQVTYAISYEAAAQRYAPFLSSISQVRARGLEGTGVDTALSDLAARPVNEGANFMILDTTSPGDLLFRSRLGDAWLASPVQVYLDLLRAEGRAKDMAEHLRKERLGF